MTAVVERWEVIVNTVPLCVVSREPMSQPPISVSAHRGGLGLVEITAGLVQFEGEGIDHGCEPVALVSHVIEQVAVRVIQRHPQHPGGAAEAQLQGIVIEAAAVSAVFHQVLRVVAKIEVRRASLRIGGENMVSAGLICTPGWKAAKPIATGLTAARCRCRAW